MHPHSTHPIVAVVLMVLFFAGVLAPALSAMDVTLLRKQIAEALLEALRETKMAHKEAYMPMGLSKGQWSKVLGAEKALGVDRLHRVGVPFRFYVKVWEHLLAIKARDFSCAVREDAAIEQRVTQPEKREAAHAS